MGKVREALAGVNPEGVFLPLVIDTLEVYADNTAAAALVAGTIYRTSLGVLMIKY
jgi:hypothetical protein